MTFSRSINLLKDPVLFVTSSETCDTSGDTTQHQNRNDKGILSGPAAKEIYESILKEPSSSTQTSSNYSSLSQKRLSPLSDFKLAKNSKYTLPKKTMEDYNHKLFRAAENGDLKEIETIISNKFADLNCFDMFKWTPLMMASYNGNIDVVKYLLFNGAKWKEFVDSSGYDAYDLACIGGHDNIAHLLTYSIKFIESQARNQALKTAHKIVKTEKMWCKLCKCKYTAPSYVCKQKGSHLNSVLHQFAEHQNTSPQSHYHLDCQNRGYRMLRLNGWNGISGLGPSGKGKKYPVKTILKNNRFGLGLHHSEKCKRVTHFAPGDTKAVEPMDKKKCKTKTGNDQETFQQKEIAFRRSFWD